MSRILVTGGGGFIGSNLVQALLERGHRVRVIDDFTTGRRENLEEVLHEIELIDEPEGILSPSLCAQAVRGVGAILHQAAIPSVPRSIANPVLADRVNVGGTLALLEAARREGVRRVVCASSSSVYGDAPGEIRREDGPVVPLSPYAVSKRALEHYAILYHRLHGMETVVLRYFNVFGPRQDPHSTYAAVVPIFTRRLLAGESPPIYGDGEQSRDFTYVENVVQGNLLAMEAGGVGGEIFNLAMGANHTVNEMFRLIRDIVGAEGLWPDFGPPRPGDVLRSQADVSKAERMLGYRGSVSLKEGLRRSVAWYREMLDGERDPRGRGAASEER